MTGHARAYRFFLAQVFAVLAILIPWQIAASKGFLNPLAFSDPVAIARSIYQWIADGTMLDDILSTMKILAVGYLIGLALGMGIGLALALSPYAKAFLGPFIVFGNAVPRIVLVPFLVTGLGFGDLPKIVLVVIVIVFVVAVTIEQGVAGINKDIVDHVTLLGAGRFGLFRDVYIPGIALWTIISARLCIGYALQAAILAEFFGANHGLGFRIVQSQEAYDVSGIYGALVATMVIAVLLDRVLAKVESFGTKWLPSGE